MIEFKNVSKIYSDGFQALTNINLKVKEGEFLVLIGPSGSGKTTCMKMINRLIEPSQGSIYINGKNITHEDPVKLRRQIGYVIQHIGLLPHMTIAENVALVPKLLKWDKNDYMNRVNELLNMVNLNPETYMNRYPSELSGGQQQRVGVIRALAANPPIILMDEPFSALDPISREQLQDELLRLQEKIHKTIVFVTHDIDEAIKIADKIGILNQGHIVQLDTPDHILRHPANDFVRLFIGENRLTQTGALPTIPDVMVKPITSRRQAGLADSVTRMRRHNVDTLIIINSENKYLGIARVWDIQKNYAKEDMTLENIMTTDYPTVYDTQPLTDPIDLIHKHNISVVPVINNNHELMGVITRASLTDLINNHLGRQICI